jgi:hypothetical protein
MPLYSFSLAGASSFVLVCGYAAATRYSPRRGRRSTSDDANGICGAG